MCINSIRMKKQEAQLMLTNPRDTVLDNRISRFYVPSKKISPVGTDGRLPLSDLDLDLGSGHTAYRRALLIDLYLHTKFH